MKGYRTSDHIFLLQTIIEKVVKKSRNQKLFAAFIDFKKAYDTVNRETLLNQLRNLGINGILYKNIAAMYQQTEYLVKYGNGYLDAINSNIGLKQGCPLSPMLFNIYIDNIGDVFDNQCEPIIFQEQKINHFLYADDLVLISHSKEGLQRCLDKLQSFAEDKDLTISIDKSKTMIFNKTGKLIKHIFTIKGEKLEPVQSFCYLGFDINASGTTNSTINCLFDKANKAMRPILGAISRFNIPIKTSLKLFHTCIAPIMLYNVENWAILSNKKLKNCTTDTFLEMSDAKANNLHRRFLKFILGVSKSCPTLTLMGETGELPLMLKGFRLMLKYWFRVSNLPNATLAKKALLENVSLHTNWIATIEKLMNCFKLTNSIQSLNILERDTKEFMFTSYVKSWENKVISNIGRLEFYKKIKKEFGFEDYLTIHTFKERRAISKLRCSDHGLEIEKGRHKKIPREERECKLCCNRNIETEEHFIFLCNFYDTLKAKHEFRYTIDNLFNTEHLDKIGKYLVDAFFERTLKLVN